jgi:hypothetical protein
MIIFLNVLSGGSEIIKSGKLSRAGTKTLKHLRESKKSASIRVRKFGLERR